jgi:hypothetical protein
MAVLLMNVIAGRIRTPGESRVLDADGTAFTDIGSNIYVIGIAA